MEFPFSGSNTIIKRYFLGVWCFFLTIPSSHTLHEVFLIYYISHIASQQTSEIVQESCGLHLQGVLFTPNRKMMVVSTPNPLGISECKVVARMSVSTIANKHYLCPLHFSKNTPYQKWCSPFGLVLQFKFSTCFHPVLTTKSGRLSLLSEETDFWLSVYHISRWPPHSFHSKLLTRGFKGF